MDWFLYDRDPRHERVNYINKNLPHICLKGSQPFKRLSHNMVKRTQTIWRLLPTNFLSVFDHFVGLALKGLNTPMILQNGNNN